MTRELKEQIVEAARAYMADRKITQTDLARQSGVSKEYLSHMLNGKFAVSAGKNLVIISDAYFKRLADFIGFRLEKEYWTFRPTPQITALLAYLEDARRYGTTHLIVGETGSGKTYGVDIFLRKYPADVFKITVGSTDNLADLLDKIIDRLHIPSGKTKSKRLRDIAKKLRSLREQGGYPMLIFDEAEYMKQPALASMKELYDALFRHAAIVLIGTDQLLSNIDRLRRKNKPGMPQFYRRIKFGIRRLRPVDRRFDMFLKDLPLDAGAKRFVRSICDNYGELHDVLVPVLRESERTGEPVTENFIRKVLNLTEVYA